MAAKKPFVSTCVGGIQDLAAIRANLNGPISNVGNGFLVDPDPHLFFECIERLVADESLRQEMGSEGAKFAFENHSDAQLSESMKSFYNFLLTRAEESSSDRHFVPSDAAWSQLEDER
jgi:glycosyltransferase involved in cell wall biosynthesis